MKQILLMAVAVLMLSACKNENKTENGENEIIEPTPVDTTAMGTTPPTAEAVYVCPMHPEVIGTQGEKCSKCDMDLVPKDPTTPGE